MTNAEKFYDVFGFEPETICPNECPKEETRCRDCKYFRWLEKEYEEPDLLPFE